MRIRYTHAQIQRRLRTAAVVALATGATAGGAAGLAATPASAAYDFHNGYLAAGYIAQSNLEWLRATLGWAESAARKAEVAAANPNGSVYGSWISGWETACHSYAGTTWLRGLLRNPHTVSQNPIRGRVRVDPEIACGSFGLLAPVGEVASEISASFAIFRDQPASPVPEDVAESAVPPSLFGADASLAREIPTTTGTGWVVPGRDYLCIVQPDPVDGYGTSCTTVEQAKRAGLYIGLRPDGELSATETTVLVRDGATLTATDAEGTPTVVANKQDLAEVDGVATLSVEAGTEVAVTG